MKITQTTLPPSSLLNQSAPYDYQDSYRLVLNDEANAITLDAIGKAFITSAPAWISALMKLRNAVVGPLGLKTGTSASHASDTLELKPGNRIGIFKILTCTQNEIIVGEDDSHLNFKVSLWLNTIGLENHDKEIILSSVVNFNNWFGRLYFLPVKPFHKLIVPAMLKAMSKQLKNDSIAFKSPPPGEI